MKKTSATGLLNCSAAGVQCLCPSSMAYETSLLVAQPLPLFLIKRRSRRTSFVEGLGLTRVGYCEVVLKNGDFGVQSMKSSA